jgi:prevent-host-death family protein
MASLPNSLPPDRASHTVKRSKAARSVSSRKIASVAVAKANLSALIKSVEQNREEITLVRRGVPVAKIVPIIDQKLQFGYGWMSGSVRELGNIVGPTGEEWDARNE